MDMKKKRCNYMHRNESLGIWKKCVNSMSEIQ